MSEPLGPGRLADYDDGTFGLLIVDFSPVDEVIDGRQGLQGGGHTWAMLTRAIAERDAPELLDGVDLDPEADMFVARSASRASIEALAAALDRYFTDPAALTALLDDLGDAARD